MVDVFISYSKTDRGRVSQLARAIEDEGYAVWWDAELPLHQSYGDVITEKIERAKAAIVVWSPDAVASEWVRAEADTARNHKKLIQTALGDIIPPMPFNQIQCANLEDWNGEPDHEGWRKVRQSLAALCGDREKAAPAGATAAPAAEPAGEAAADLAITRPLDSSQSEPPKSIPEPAPGGAPPPPAKKSGPLAQAGPAAVPILIGVGVAILGLVGYALTGPGQDDAAMTLLDGGETAIAGKPGEISPGQPDAAAAPIVQPNVAAAPVAPVVPADDFNRDVSLVNGSGETIFYLYWSPVEDGNWGEDRLGSDVLQPGQQWQVTVDNGSGACNYDFMGVTADGREIVRQNVDVCSVWEINFN